MKNVDVRENLHIFITGDKNKFTQNLMEYLDRMPETYENNVELPFTRKKRY